MACIIVKRHYRVVVTVIHILNTDPTHNGTPSIKLEIEILDHVSTYQRKTYERASDRTRTYYRQTIKILRMR